MPSSLRNQIPLKFTGRGLSDAVDGTNVQAGAMRVLTNLILNPRTPGTFICRPAAEIIVDLFDHFDHPTQITALEVVGNLAYGMASTDRFAGKDEPFVYDLANSVFLAVDGVTADNTPASPAEAGEWEPPIIRHVGSRVIVTHPGFPGGDVKLGWFDTSGFSLSTTGNLDEQRSFLGDTDTVKGPFIVGLPPGTLPGGADIGSTVTGSGIPANTTITSVDDVAVVFAGTTNGTTAVTSITIDGVADTTGLYIGQVVQGADIPDGTQIGAINRGAFSLTLTQAATGPGVVGEAMAAIGREIGLSQAPTATADSVAFTMFNESVITGNPAITGVEVGMRVVGSGVPAGAAVSGATTTEISVSGLTVVGSNRVQVLVFPAGFSLGMGVSGNGIPSGSTLLGTTGLITGEMFIIISNPATAAGWTAITLTGAQITLTTPISIPANGVALTILGGTATAPLWGAGDTQPVALPSRPVGVAEMNGRAYYALGEDGAGFSDSLLPTRITNATQFLLPGNGLAVTAIGELKLTSTQLGGNVQGLLAFQGDADIQQITGDSASGNLTMVDLHCATGTHAPLTIVSTTKGTFFVSPEGLRLVGFSGQVSDPIGQDGQGIVGPFLDVTNPPLPGSAPASRMCAAANGRTVRITVPTADGFAEYWHDMPRSAWTGPHTSSAGQIRNWSNTFLVAPTTDHQKTQLRRSDDVPNGQSVYVEGGTDLRYEWEPTLMPDTGLMSENCVIESAIMIALMPGEQTQIDFLNETRDNLDGVSLAGLVIPEALWGTPMPFDVLYLGPDTGVIRQRQIPWRQPLVFKQGTVNIRGLSSANLVLGNLYLRYQVLGYMLEVQQIPAA